jgi:hypothetical protein
MWQTLQGSGVAVRFRPTSVIGGCGRRALQGNRYVLFSDKGQVQGGEMNSMPSDRIEIQELVHRYCDALCRRDCDAWVATWAEDGLWNSGRGEVEVDGDTAHGRWYITEYGLTAKGRRTFYIAHYDDDYRRTAEGWRFARRIATWPYHGEPDLTGTFGPPPGYT